MSQLLLNATNTISTDFVLFNDRLLLLVHHFIFQISDSHVIKFQLNDVLGVVSKFSR